MCVGGVGGVGRARVPGCCAVLVYVCPRIRLLAAKLVALHVASVCVAMILKVNLMKSYKMLYKTARLGPALQNRLQETSQAKRLIYG